MSMAVAIAVAVPVAIAIAVAVPVAISVPVAVSMPIAIPVAMSITIALQVAISVAIAIALQVAISVAIPMPITLVRFVLLVQRRTRCRVLERKWRCSMLRNGVPTWRMNCRHGLRSQCQRCLLKHSSNRCFVGQGKRSKCPTQEETQGQGNYEQCHQGKANQSLVKTVVGIVPP